MDVGNVIINLITEYQTIIGSFIGTIGAGLVAYFSIKSSFNKQKLIERDKLLESMKKERKIYDGFIFALLTDFSNVKVLYKNLLNELSAYQLDIPQSLKIPVEKPISRVSNEISKKLFQEIIKYENFNSKIISQLTLYISISDDYYSNLNFEPLIKLKFKDEADLISRCSGYFEAIIKKHSILIKEVDKIIELLKQELVDSPLADLITENKDLGDNL